MAKPLLIKAYLEKAGESDTEIRRFYVQPAQNGRFTYKNLKAGVFNYFPSLATQSFSLFWKDEDGELILISSDAELQEASNNMPELLKIIVRINCFAGQREGDQVHAGVVCDGCQRQIEGSRFKCCICSNYDLCSTCEKEGLHSEHKLHRIRTPLPQTDVSSWQSFLKRCEQMKNQMETDEDDEEADKEKQLQREKMVFEDIQESVGNLLDTLGVNFTINHKDGDSTSEDEEQQDSEAGQAESQVIDPTSVIFGNRMWPPTPTPQFYHPLAPVINDTLERLKNMGFSDDNGQLTSLVTSKQGNLNETLDALRSQQDASED